MHVTNIMSVMIFPDLTSRLTSLGSLVSSLPSLTSLQAANNQINQINDLVGLQELVKHIIIIIIIIIINNNQIKDLNGLTDLVKQFLDSWIPAAKNHLKLMSHWEFMPSLTSFPQRFARPLSDTSHIPLSSRSYPEI